MNADKIKELWNSQVDEFNQWDKLSTNEMIDFTITEVVTRCAEIADEHKYNTAGSPCEYETACLDIFGAINAEFDLSKAD